MTTPRPTDARIEIVEGDITMVRADAIVNAANNTLLGGGGVDGAIHRAAGPQLLADCRALGGCDTGAAKLTLGHNLPAKYVIHTPGPVWHGGTHGEDALLAACYRAVFGIVVERGFRTVAAPSVSTGAYGFPLERAAAIAVREIREALAANRRLERVTIVCFASDVADVYRATLAAEAE